MLRLIRGEAVGKVLRRLGVLGDLMRRRRWSLASLVALGLVASILEGSSVALIVGLVYRLVGAPVATGGGEAASDVATELTRLSTTALIVLFAGVVGLRTLLASAYTLLEGRLSASIADEVRTSLYAKIVGAPFDYVARRGAGSLLNVLEWESQAVPDTIHRLASVIMDVTAVLVYAVLVIALSWRLALAGLLGGVLLTPVLVLVGGGLRRKSEQLRRSYELLSEVTVSTLEALRTVRLLGAGRQAAAQQREASGEVARNSVRIAGQQAFTSPVRKIAFLLVSGALLMLLARSGFQRATVLTLFAILYRIMPHVTAIEGQAMQLARNSAALESTLGLLSADLGGVSPRPRSASPRSFKRIDFANVGFQHQGADEPCLSEVELILERGSFTAVTGPSGGGKTTLVNLLGRLHEPTAGRVLVDGRPLSDIDAADWLQVVAFAGQDVDLLAGTILDNLRLGRPDAPIGDIREALTVAQAAAFVDDLPDGLDTRVGDRGTRLSGGQRQRLVIARALARRPGLLVLDEATNAVDPDMEESIYHAIRRSRPDLTLLVVTHRGDTSLADCTIVVDRGRVRRVTPHGAGGAGVTA